MTLFTADGRVASLETIVRHYAERLNSDAPDVLVSLPAASGTK